MALSAVQTTHISPVLRTTGPGVTRGKDSDPSAANPNGVTAVERDHDELAAIHREHGEALRRLCQRQLRSTADADDAVQEVLLRAWGALPGFDRSRPMWPWLATIARNVCNDVHRRRRTEERRRMPTAGSGPAPDEGLLRADRDAVVREAVTRLPGSAATVLYLRDVEGWGYDEIAAHLDRKPGAARTAVTRARQQLRAQVEAVARTRGQWPLSGVFGGWLSRRRLSARIAGHAPSRVDPALADLGGLLANHGAHAAAGALVVLGSLVAGLGGGATPAPPAEAAVPVVVRNDVIDREVAAAAPPGRLGGAEVSPVSPTRPSAAAPTSEVVAPVPVPPAPAVDVVLPSPALEPDTEPPVPLAVVLPASDPVATAPVAASSLPVATADLAPTLP